MKLKKRDLKKRKQKEVLEKTKLNILKQIEKEISLGNKKWKEKK